MMWLDETVGGGGGGSLQLFTAHVIWLWIFSFSQILTQLANVESEVITEHTSYIDSPLGKKQCSNLMVKSSSLMEMLWQQQLLGGVATVADRNSTTIISMNFSVLFSYFLLLMFFNDENNMEISDTWSQEILPSFRTSHYGNGAKFRTDMGNSCLMIYILSDLWDREDMAEWWGNFW